MGESKFLSLEAVERPCFSHSSSTSTHRADVGELQRSLRLAECQR